MKKVLIASMFLMFLAGVSYGITINAEMPSATVWESSVVTASSQTATLCFAETDEPTNKFFYNGTGGIVYVGDYTVTASTFTAAGGFPVASGSTFSPDDPFLFKGNLYVILPAGTTGTAPLKKFAIKK